MVKLLFFLLLLRAELLPPISPSVITSAAPSNSMAGRPAELVTEFNKNAHFAGEQIVAHFILYSDSPFEEVEVVKFPEFDGYWTENQALRQGRLILGPATKGRYKVLIGSYGLIPMLARREPRIEPMHLLLKSTGALLRSTGKAPTPKTLPQFTDSSTSAVGALTVQYSERIDFTPDQPTSISITIQGEGNFPEIEIGEFTFPPEIERVSQRAVISGQGAFGAKTFEISIIPHTTLPHQVPAITFTHFDPRQNRHVRSPIGPFTLSPISVTANEPSPALTLPIVVTPMARASTRQILLHPLVVTLNLLFLFLTAFFLYRAKRRRPRPVHATPITSMTTATTAWQPVFDEAMTTGRAMDALSILLKAINQWGTQNSPNSLTAANCGGLFHGDLVHTIAKNFGTEAATETARLISQCEITLYSGLRAETATQKTTVSALRRQFDELQARYLPAAGAISINRT